ncbi:MAG: hypothetical protein M1819_000479 [Sarea resinae]|nr:MAG: hypothetical protein M1819_000479 [Sarea resinae]
MADFRSGIYSALELDEADMADRPHDETAPGSQDVFLVDAQRPPSRDQDDRVPKESEDLEDRSADANDSNDSNGALHETSESSPMHSLKQRSRLLLTTVIQSVITGILVAAIVLSLYLFGRKSIIVGGEKLFFNALITGLPILLSLNIMSGFKSQMTALRWKLLSSRRGYDLEQVDKILQLDQLREVLSLAISRKTTLILRLAFIIWVILNIAAQVGLAMLGLTYQLNSIQMPHGINLVADLSQFKPGHWWQPVNPSSNSTKSYRSSMSTDIFNALKDFNSPSNSSTSSRNISSSRLSHAIANQYGASLIDLNFNQPVEAYSDGFMCLGNVCTYQFYSQSYSSGHYKRSNRTVNASTECTSYKVMAGGTGNLSTVTIFDRKETREKDIGTANPPGNGTITYIFSNSKGSLGSCGSRCSNISVFQSSGEGIGSVPHFFECNTTISNVSNAGSDSKLNIPAKMAQLIAAGIAFDGSGWPIEFQKQTWPDLWADPFAIYGNNDTADVRGTADIEDTTGIESLVAQFAQAIIVNLDQSNQQIPATAYQKGVRLEVDWPHTILVLAITGGCHIVLTLVLTLIASNVVIVDKSPVTMARLLAPYVTSRTVSEQASSLIPASEIMRRESGRLVYGVHTEERKEGNAVHHLGIARLGQDDVEAMERFPEGEYGAPIQVAGP